MAAKAEITGVVVSDKMEKTVRSRSSGRRATSSTARRSAGPRRSSRTTRTTTSKVGDRVAIVEARPMSRRKRWVVTRVVEKAKQI